jgi:glycosyltransferase involved in cell wall biosynthesis
MNKSSENQPSGLGTFSICLMAFNEENTIGELIVQALARYADDDCLTEILIINNASTDSTPEIVLAISKDNPKVKLISLSTNSQYSGGCRKALETARGEFIIVADGDSQHPIYQIEKFRQMLHMDFDVVFGHRTKRAEPFSRKFSSKVLKVLSRSIINFKGPDVNCGIRGVRRSIVSSILPQITANLVNPEIYARAKINGLNIGFVQVTQHARPDLHLRESTFNFSNPLILLNMVLSYLKLVRSIRKD